MTIVMTAKHQVTIPKKITDALGLDKGSMFDVVVYKNKLELVPLEVREKTFSEEEYGKLDTLSKKERGMERRLGKRS